MYPKNQKEFAIHIDSVYVKDGEIELLKRNAEPFKGYRHFVGRYIEDNESLKKALTREFKEEMGSDVMARAKKQDLSGSLIILNFKFYE